MLKELKRIIAEEPCPGSGIFCWYAVHGDENAEILLFHRISAKLFTDNRYAFFLSDIAFLY